MNKRRTLAAERQAMLLQMEELKNEKVRQQLQEMEAAKTQTEPNKKQVADVPAKHKAHPTVPRARIRLRHIVGLLGLVIMVGGPVAISAWYLWNRAHDRYLSYAGFSVRTEEVGSALEFLGGVAQFSGSSSSDTDILYKFIQSPELVAIIDEQFDLRAIWSKPGSDWTDPETDPVFAYNPDGGILGVSSTGSPFVELSDGDARGSIEDLTKYWQHRVKVHSDSGTGLIDLEVEAFTPEEAQQIAQAIYLESSEMINRLTAIARDDATRYAREELEDAVDRLKEARADLTKFRNRTQIVDPTASIQGQMGLLSSLQAQLAQALIDLDILRQTSRGNDPRVTQEERRVQVIEDRIAEERLKLGIGASGGEVDETAFANLVGEYERLAVDLEFAELSYTSALAAYDSALAEAQRQSRYLAAHVNPTLPESAVRPERLSNLGMVGLFAFLIWATTFLVLYAIRDRR
ncbi:MAG: capsule biosynthesis protein [Sulfitobacter sp.]